MKYDVLCIDFFKFQNILSFISIFKYIIAHDLQYSIDVVSKHMYIKMLDISFRDKINIVPTSQVYQQERISKVMLQNRSEYVQEHATKFHRILKDVIKKELMADLFLPRFAEIYISLLQNNPVSIKDFRDFESMYKDDSRIQHVKGLELLVYLYNVKNIDEAKEKQIHVYLQWFEQIEEIEMHHIYPIVFLALEPLYVVSKESAKLNFVPDQGYVNLDRLQLKDVNDLLHFMDQNQNPLWKRFLSDTHDKQKYQLTKVMKLIEEQHYQEALDIVQRLEGANRVYTTYDPFASLMWADNLVMTESKMYLEDFVKTLVALQKSIDINKKNSQAYFSIGNAIYNTTWFGNSSTLIRHSKTHVSWNQGITDMSRAKKYYTKALDYATSDEERAQIIYALAKVELVEVSVVLAEKEGHPGYWEAPYYMRKKKTNHIQKNFRNMDLVHILEKHNPMIIQNIIKMLSKNVLFFRQKNGESFVI